MQRLPIPGTPHPTSPKHLTDWNDSGSVLKFLGTHRRHRLRASASPSPGLRPAPIDGWRKPRAWSPPPQISRKRRVNRAGPAQRPRPQCIPAPRALTPRTSRAPSVATTPRGLPCTSSFENPLIYSFHTFEPGGKPVHRPPTPAAAPAPRCGFQLSASGANPRFCQPQTCPGTCPRRAWQARTLPSPRASPPPPSSLLLPPSPRQPGLRWEGALGACHPPSICSR